MKLSRKSMLLYAVTDRMWLEDKTLVEAVEGALKGGITFLQLREKNLDYATFLTEAKEIRTLSTLYNIPFVINDDIEICLAAHADGVHIGQEDGDVLAVRKKIGSDKILGVSVQTVAQAVKAQNDGADYLGVGAMFPTDTKSDAVVVTKDELLAISKAVDVPIVIIGGMNENTIPQFKNWGADGAAVVSAIFAQKNSCQATEKLLKLCDEVF